MLKANGIIKKGANVIEYKKGNLLKSDTEAIINTVNCVGVMGRGIALQFKKQYPDNYKYYDIACRKGEVVPGKVLIYNTNQLVNPKYIINFPTKRHWRGASKIEDIKSGLDDLVKSIRSLNIKSIAVPPLGCGLGGLDWADVKSQIEIAFVQIPDVDITVFEPSGAPLAEEIARNVKIPNMTYGRAALVCLTKQYLNGLLDPFVTLLEIHKLMYFMQESGESLRLRYNKAPYGPYAENLSHVLKEVEGHFLSGYADGGDNPDKQIQVVPGAEKDAIDFLSQEQYSQTRKRITRVSELVDGFETQFGLELLATVYWVIKNESATTLQDIIKKTYRWGNQKQKFNERQIKIATERLIQEFWVESSITL